MLPTSDMLLMAMGVAVVLLTPGPTNTLLATAGLQYGFRHSMLLASVELAGYVISISIWGYLLFSTPHRLPWYLPAVQGACAIYLGWLAMRMWHASIDLGHFGQRLVTRRSFFFATLLNPKGLLFASTIFPKRAFIDLPDYLASMAEFTTLLVPIGLCWIALGAKLRAGEFLWLGPVRVQRSAAIILSVFSLCIIWAAAHEFS